MSIFILIRCIIGPFHGGSATAPGTSNTSVNVAEKNRTLQTALAHRTAALAPDRPGQQTLIHLRKTTENYIRSREKQNFFPPQRYFGHMPLDTSGDGGEHAPSWVETSNNLRAGLRNLDQFLSESETNFVDRDPPVRFGNFSLWMAAFSRVLRGKRGVVPR